VTITIVAFSSIILLLFTLFIPVLVEGSSGGWTLTITLVDKPWGAGKVSVGVEGPHGYDEKYWYNWDDIQTYDDEGIVDFPIPSGAIPEGNIFKVCASPHALIGSFVDMNCQWFSRSTDGDSQVTVSLD
jgi:hypothetical protein